MAMTIFVRSNVPRTNERIAVCLLVETTILTQHKTNISVAVRVGSVRHNSGGG